MPEMLFHVRWPDDSTQVCYSPSLVIKDHFAVGESYGLPDFLVRSRTALTIASERVRDKFGFACSRAIKQLEEIEAIAARYEATPDARVKIVAFEE